MTCLILFHLEPVQFFLSHKGSSSNTYQSVSPSIPTPLEPNRSYSFPGVATLQILGVQHSFTTEGLMPNQIEFSEKINCLRTNQFVKLVGLNKQSLSSITNCPGLKYSNTMQEHLWETDLNFCVPYLKIQVIDHSRTRGTEEINR